MGGRAGGLGRGGACKKMGIRFQLTLMRSVFKESCSSDVTLWVFIPALVLNRAACHSGRTVRTLLAREAAHVAS